MIGSYHNQTMHENSRAEHGPCIIHVYGETVVKEFDNHIRIRKEDWNKFSPRIIEALKQGDKKHATGNTETTEEINTPYRD